MVVQVNHIVVVPIPGGSFVLLLSCSWSWHNPFRRGRPARTGRKGYLLAFGRPTYRVLRDGLPGAFLSTAACERVMPGHVGLGLPPRGVRGLRRPASRRSHTSSLLRRPAGRATAAMLRTSALGERCHGDPLRSMQPPVSSRRRIATVDGESMLDIGHPLVVGELRFQRLSDETRFARARRAFLRADMAGWC